MKKTYIISLALLSLLFIPVFANASLNVNLQYGLQGDSDVKQLQEFLINKGLLTGTATGNFFSLTLKAVKAYQTSMGINPTGYVGPLTRKSINNDMANINSPGASNGPTNTQTNIATSPPVNYDWSTYTALPDNFSKNPPAYIGTKIKISGSILDFLAKGDRGGDNNIIEIIETNVNSSTTVGAEFALEIDDNSSYQTATQLLNKLDAVLAYGTIGASSTFYTTSGGVVVLPAIQVIRLDKCANMLFCLNNNATQTIFGVSPDVGTNSPSSLLPPAISAPTQQPTITQPTSTSSQNQSVKCYTDNQCGTNLPIGSLVCQSNAVYQSYVTYICNNPGTPQAYCLNSTSQQLQQTCNSSQTCGNGMCNNIISPTPTPQTGNQNNSPVSSGTVSQENAVKSAQSYLSFTAFSHDGLVAQLEYDQFSNADAVYGADNSGADWNAEAVKAAKQYMSFSAFSRGGLIAQLEYDKFTEAQAEYGVNAVGL